MWQDTVLNGVVQWHNTRRHGTNTQKKKNKARTNRKVFGGGGLIFFIQSREHSSGQIVE